MREFSICMDITMSFIASLSIGKERAKEERKRNEHQGDPTNRSLRQIRKPKGRAGRADGYQIIDALGLSKRKRKYNKIAVRLSVPQFLCSLTVCYLTGPCTPIGLPVP